MLKVLFYCFLFYCSECCRTSNNASNLFRLPKLISDRKTKAKSYSAHQALGSSFHFLFSVCWISGAYIRGDFLHTAFSIQTKSPLLACAGYTSVPIFTAWCQKCFCSVFTWMNKNWLLFLAVIFAPVSLYLYSPSSNHPLSVPSLLQTILEEDVEDPVYQVMLWNKSLIVISAWTYAVKLVCLSLSIKRGSLLNNMCLISFTEINNSTVFSLLFFQSFWINKTGI